MAIQAGDIFEGMVVRFLPLEAILLVYRDGDGRGWEDEFEHLRYDHRSRIEWLTRTVVDDGFKEPILLGSDGRIWDGHHRLCVAHDQRILLVPVVFSGDKDAHHSGE